MFGWFARLGTLGKTVAVATSVAVAGGATAGVIIATNDDCLPDMVYTTRDAEQTETALFWRLDCGDQTVRINARNPLDVSLSPDGQQVAYSDVAEEFDSGLDGPERQIFIANRSGATRQFTHLPGEATAPSWSPNGVRIGFVHGGSFWFQGLTGDLEPREVMPFDGYQVAWSADSRKAYLIEPAGGGLSTIIEFNLVTDEATRLDTLQTAVTNATLSPDGDHLLFTSTNPVGERALRQYNLTNGSFTPVTGVGDNAISPGAVTATWHAFYGTYNAEVLPGEDVNLSDTGIHAYNLTTGQDRLVVPGQSIQSLDVVTTGQPGPKPPVVQRRSTFAALGDSYSSGEGAPGLIGYREGTDTDTNKCHRSDNAYPTLLHRANPHLGPDFNFYACSGALIQDFWRPFADNEHDGVRGKNKGEMAQLDWLDANTKTITLTIGGNNVNFAAVMEYCARRSVFGPTCQSVWEKAVGAAIANMATSGNTHDDLSSLYVEIRRRAPNAQVFVLGYPRFFPTPPVFGRCETGIPSFVFFDTDMAWMNETTAKVDDLIRQTANTAGLHYVDTFDAFEGHSMCAITRWFNLAQLPRESSYHPSTDGQKRLSEVTLDVIG